MSTDQAIEEIKCIVVKMPADLARKLEEYKVKTNKSKNAALIELIKKGLNSI